MSEEQQELSWAGQWHPEELCCRSATGSSEPPSDSELFPWLNWHSALLRAITPALEHPRGTEGGGDVLPWGDTAERVMATKPESSKAAAWQLWITLKSRGGLLSPVWAQQER